MPHLRSQSALGLVLLSFLVVLLAADVAVGQSCFGSAYQNIRTYDGTCNNPFDTDLGSTGEFYRRGPEGAAYGPGHTPINRGIERVISNKIARADPSARDAIPHSLFATQFGQFVNHDLDNNLFVDPNSATDYPDILPVPETNDDFCLIYADLTAGNLTLINACLPPYNEPDGIATKFSNLTIECGVPMVTNEATAYLDLHQIYGPTAAINSALRTHSGGKLLTKNYVNFTTSPAITFTMFQYGFTAGPFDCLDCPPSWGQTGGAVPVTPLLDPSQNPTVGPDQSFVSGDARVGENGALTLFHILFIRNHNRHAGIVASANPSWNDEAVFQEARRRNIAEYQAVVMYQYFPTEFGSYFNDVLGPYWGYNPFVDVDTNVAFSSAAFRYGHSSFHNYVPLDSCGVPTLFGQTAFPGDELVFGAQTGGLITPIDVIGEIGSFENLIRGLISQVTAPNDIMIDDSLRNLPFRFPVAGGTDLLALDIHRGRENGIQNYAALQVAYGTLSGRIYGSPGCPEKYSRKTDPDPLACFTNLVPYNATLASNLQSIYTKINNIDGIVGLLVEPHVDGTSFGATLGNIIADQYQRARAGDRFWFENLLQANPFSIAQIVAFRATTMGYLLRQNFGFPDPSQVPNNPFLSPANYVFTLGHSC